jgi:hypothetical protein
MSIFKRSVLGLSLAACATLLLPVFTGTANAAPGALIRNYQSGKCLDADANFLGYNGGQSPIARRRAMGDQPSRPNRPSQASHEFPTCPEPRAVGYLLAISLRC